jgi:ribosomal protein S18 acetylase RimI-like enzyme
MEINQTALADIYNLRREYLSCLVRFQDIYLEFLVSDSVAYQIIDNEQIVGYAIVYNDNNLVEYYIVNDQLHQCTHYFSTLINKLSISIVSCKSFDFTLLNCCLINALRYSIVGYLYRDFIDMGIQSTTDLFFRYANLSDLPFLAKQDDDVFEPKEMLKEFIVSKAILIVQKQRSVVGCGFLTRVTEDFNYFDLGVWVDPAYRKQGHATQIMSYMRQLCLNNDWIPICGCDASNFASQKMLSNVGFVSNHKLIEFKV